MNKLHKFMREMANVWKITDTKIFFIFFLNTLRHFPNILQTKSLASVDRGMRNRKCFFYIYNGRKLELTIDDEGLVFGLAREIYGRNVYLKTLNYHIQPNSVVIDLGANAGVFTTMAALCGAKVFAVEAQSGFLPLIKANLQVNNCSEKVALTHGLIGSGTGVFSEDDACFAASYWNEPPPLLSMEGLLEAYDIERVDFLKIDIEGSEFDLLENSASWLENVQVIALEVHPEFGNVADLVEILVGVGFDVWQLDNDQNSVTMIIDEIGYVFASRP